MKPAIEERNLEVHGSLSQGTFGISNRDEDKAHILAILRDKMYSNKILAVLREYSTNAWDAHIDAGKGDVPIKVSIPTRIAPDLFIRDYGHGLSEQDIYEVYAQYGASTKRQSNEVVGFLGLGSKSAFAYSDTFTITSFHAGTKKVYTAAIDESNVGIVSKLHEEPTTETGIEIRVPVSVNDIWQFEREASSLFRFFDPQPDINLGLDGVGEVLSNGFLSTSNRGEWQAIMGVIPYRLNFRTVEARLREEGVWDFSQKHSGALKFSIGEVDVTASREELEYTDKTQKAVVTRLLALREEMRSKLKEIIDDPDHTPWGRRLRVRGFLSQTGLGASSDEEKKWAADTVKVYTLSSAIRHGPPTKTPQPNPPKTFRLARPDYHWKYSSGRKEVSQTDTIPIQAETCLVLRDTHKSFWRHDLPHNCELVLVDPKGEFDEEEFQKYLDDVDLTGLALRRLTEFAYHPPTSSRRNTKYSKQVFTLSQSWNTYTKPKSSVWDPTDELPEDDQPYVVLDAFHPIGLGYYSLKSQIELLEDLDLPVPTLFGFRDTKKNPVDVGSITATPWKTWLENTLQEALERDDIQQALRGYWWSKHLRGEHLKMKPLVRELGIRHPIVDFASTLQREVKHFDKEVEEKLKDALPTLISSLEIQDPILEELKKIGNKYPLMGSSFPSYLFFNTPQLPLWAHYVQLIDSQEIK